MIDLSIVIVSWNVCDLLRQCILSILAERSRSHEAGDSRSSIDIEIIVIDNGSSDESVRMLREEFPDVLVIENDSNPGFATANNQGIAQAHGRYLLLLNPDAEVVGGALATLIGFADSNPDVGLLGPQLLNSDGSVQSSMRRFPTIATALFESTWLEPVAPGRLTDRYHVRDRDASAPLDVDWVQGAALFARREVIEQVGGMDEQYFMYSEELDWCRCIKNAGWRIVYFPDAQVVHHGGKSSDQVIASRHIHFQTSKVLYFRKYHGVLVSELLRMFLLGNYVWQLGVEGLKWLLGHRRSLRLERIAAYCQLLGTGLRVHGPGWRTTSGNE